MTTMSSGFCADSRSAPGIVPSAGRIDGIVVDVVEVGPVTVVVVAELVRDDDPQLARRVAMAKPSIGS